MSTTFSEPLRSSKTIYQLNPNRWMDQYFDFFYNYTITRVNCSEIAKDLIQDTFFSALKSAKNYRGTATERTWLISILKRKIIDYYRKKNSKKEKMKVNISHFKTKNGETVNWLEEFIPDPNGIHTNFIENEELGLIIEECISRLPEKQAQVFTMKTIYGYSTDEICEALKINRSNLWVIIHRARVALMESLNEHWFFEKSA